MNCPRCGNKNIHTENGGRWSCYACSRSGSPPGTVEPVDSEGHEWPAPTEEETEDEHMRPICLLCSTAIAGTGKYPLCQADGSEFGKYPARAHSQAAGESEAAA